MFQALSELNNDLSGTMTIKEARKVFKRINSRLGKTYTKEEKDELFE